MAAFVLRFINENTMRNILFILTLAIHSISYSQEIVVEKVKFDTLNNNGHFSEIPKVRDVSNANSKAVEKINAQILDRFMINSFEPNDNEDFRWYDVKCGSEIKGDILYIWFKGEYFGAYPNYVEDDFYFDIQSGELLTLNVIPFHALFTLQGYFDFLNKYWLNGVKSEFDAAIDCAGSPPYCSYYDIYNFTVDGGKLTLSLASDCYPHVAQACTPIYETSVAIDSVKDYLNEPGKYVLIESDYFSKSAIEKFIENKKLKNKVPDNVYLFGKIDGKFPFSMALNRNKSQGELSGFYYYDNKLRPIAIVGQENEGMITLTETVDGKTTGQFVLQISKDYQSKGFFLYDPDGNDSYLVGQWMNPEKTKTYDIEFTEVKMCNKK
jgi:hypothetical protein